MGSPLTRLSLFAWLALAALGCAACGAATGASGGDGAAASGWDAADAPVAARDLAGARDVAGREAASQGSSDAASPAASMPRSCGALALCDGFESDAVGGQPDATRWTVGAPNVTGTGTLAIDDSEHHSGTHAVKVLGQGGYSNHVFLTNVGVIAGLGPVVWGRFYLRLSDALGDGHVTFLAMTDGADGGRHLRLGGQSKILMWNRESDDATLPALSPTGIAASEPLPTGRWLCVEFNVDARAAATAMRTWVDGVEIAGLRVDATPTPDVDEPWLRKAAWSPRLTDFALGWESYAGQAMTLWFDDVALDAVRVGCL